MLSLLIAGVDDRDGSFECGRDEEPINRGSMGVEGGLVGYADCD